MAGTETQVGEVVRSHAVAIHFHVHAPPPPPPPPPRVIKAKSVSKSGCDEPSSHPSDSESSCGSEEEEDYPNLQREPPQKHYAPTGFRFPRKVPVRSSAAAATTIARIPDPLSTVHPSFAAPIAVAIGPYHHGLPSLEEMGEAKKVARDEFCRVAGQPPEVIQANISSLAADAMRCYAEHLDYGWDDEGKRYFAEMMFMDGCFLLQFMACMCPTSGDGTAAPTADGLWAKVHARVDAIARDVMLLENQLPWLVLQALMGCTPGVSWPVRRFLDLMASAFDVGNDDAAATEQAQPADVIDSPPPPHLLGLFHRRQVGAARTQDLHVPSLSSLSSTAMELAEMGVKLTASKARVFGDMTMTKRRRRLGVFGELALAPVVLNDLTACWLFNMVAHEACLGAACADNFAVSSYISVVSLLVNRREDVQELRGKSIVVSTLSDEGTLEFLKELAPHVRVGYRYYDVFERLQEYRKERWVWIAVHGSLYRNLKTIVALLSVVGVLAGLFKTILSVKQPQRG